MFTPKKIILTAGPAISAKEIKYVTDAVTNGWNEHYADYVHKFEKAFAAYLGVKYAMTTSGGTGALHLSLAAFGIGSGDEVILPEITYFACSDVIMLLGAKPVFVDILPDTWCIDPEKIKKAITKKTKAIMPVYNYGNLPEMKEVMKIAKVNNLKVVEDACPAIGSLYQKKKPGTFGDAAAFSFQGAKIMVTGFGGMFVTNNANLYEKVMYLNAHGEDPKRKFWQTSVGYTYEMTNIQAALGLAQLERIDTFVKKKRQIFHWYQKRLKNIEGLEMNVEREGTLSNMWMSSIVLRGKFKVSRDTLMKKLKEKLVDTRPFFYPISSFPMYKEMDTPVAHFISQNGINLPCGMARTEEEIDYVARQVREVLSVS